MAILLLFVPAVPHHHHSHSGAVKLGECVKFCSEKGGPQDKAPDDTNDSCVAKASYLAASAQTKTQEHESQLPQLLAVLTATPSTYVKGQTEIPPLRLDIRTERGTPSVNGRRAPPTA